MVGRVAATSKRSVGVMQKQDFPKCERARKSKIRTRCLRVWCTAGAKVRCSTNTERQ